MYEKYIHAIFEIWNLKPKGKKKKKKKEKKEDLSFRTQLDSRNSRSKLSYLLFLNVIKSSPCSNICNYFGNSRNTYMIYILPTPKTKKDYNHLLFHGPAPGHNHKFTIVFCFLIPTLNSIQSDLAYQGSLIIVTTSTSTSRRRGYHFLSSWVRNLNLVPSIPSKTLLVRANQSRMMRKEDPRPPKIIDAQSISIRSHHNPPAVDKLQQLLSTGGGGSGWDKCWEQGLTPWDLGQPTPVIAHLHRQGALPKGRALVPGCGTGYDVVAIASPERRVTGLDISENAIKKAAELFSSLPEARYYSFLKVDFFTWHPTELFDLIFDYTFFCAVEPEMRSVWARKIRDILKPDGELITLMFPISDHIGGPPYKVSVSDYEEVLHPMGFKATSIVDNELAVPPRKGREKLGRWKRSLRKSSL